MKKKKLITRREALSSGIALAGGMMLPGCGQYTPPTYGNLLRMGDNLTYAAHRTLLSGKALVKEYSKESISSFPATGTVNPGDPSKPNSSDEYRKLEEGSFENWRLSMEGSIDHPVSLSIQDLKQLTSRTQITKHICEEGWSAIAEWTGVQLFKLLEHVGIKKSARFINFYSYDGWADGIDMVDALHPQTILAYGMNGQDLPVPHGAPLRLRLETQVGYKSMKYLRRIVVSDDHVETGAIQEGWAWYVGI